MSPQSFLLPRPPQPVPDFQHAPRRPNWPHRLAIALCCATFPLIWVGGLVTTRDAGMAVPDWPTTYGYNLFLFPWKSWLSGPRDLFIEHGHRLLASLVGLLTIAFVVAVFRSDRRAWMRQLALASLALVVLQGVLGGARVLLDERQLAMAHGCLGPAFFAYCAALCVCTSAAWTRPPCPLVLPAASARFCRVAVVTSALTYMQLVAGASLRHLPVTADPGSFQIFVWCHLFLAAVVAWQVLRLAGLSRAGFRQVPWLTRPALALAGLLLLQLVLGASTWVVKYGWPYFLSSWQVAAGYTVTADSNWQAAVVTGHVAVGSLILATSVLVAVRAFRLVGFRAEVGSGAAWLGVTT